MKHHQESKIEVAHQVGVRTDLRFRAMAGSLQRKIECSMQFQANLQDPATKAAQEEVRQARARKLGEKSKRAQLERKDKAKKAKQDHIASILELPEIEGDFPCNLDLTIADKDEYRQRLDEGDQAG